MTWREYLDWLTYMRRKPLPAQRVEYLLGELLAVTRNQGAMSAPLVYGTEVPKDHLVRIMDVVPWMKPIEPELPEAERVAAEIKADQAKWAEYGKYAKKKR